MLENINPVLLAGLAGCFTWAMTALGSAAVFMVRDLRKGLLNTMLGFAAGVMVAASFWSLLDPAIEMAREAGGIEWLPAVVGFILGGLALKALDHLLPHLHLESGHVEGVKSSWQRSILLVLAITIHNLPEGFAVGVAFGGLASHDPAITLGGAMSIALGMGLQNIPEGAAVSIPLKRENYSSMKAFMYGQLSGMVEPIGALIGAISVAYVTAVLPYALSFAAGAMLYVVCDELIPESQVAACGDLGFPTVGFMSGFALMMVMDIALG